MSQACRRVGRNVSRHAFDKWLFHIFPSQTHQTDCFLDSAAGSGSVGVWVEDASLCGSLSQFGQVKPNLDFLHLKIKDLVILDRMLPFPPLTFLCSCIWNWTPDELLCGAV